MRKWERFSAAGLQSPQAGLNWLSQYIERFDSAITCDIHLERKNWDGVPGEGDWSVSISGLVHNDEAPQ